MPVCLRKPIVFHGGGAHCHGVFRRMADGYIFPVSVCGAALLGVCHRYGVAAQFADGVFPRYYAPLRRGADGLDVCHPIIYPLDLANLPGIIVAVMQFNPMYYFVTMLRDVLLYNTVPASIVAVLCGVCVRVFAAGAVVL